MYNSDKAGRPLLDHPQPASVFTASCLSAKESFTSRLTSEPAIQRRRHELAGIANVSAQS